MKPDVLSPPPERQMPTDVDLRVWSVLQAEIDAGLTPSRSHRARVRRVVLVAASVLVVLACAGALLVARSRPDSRPDSRPAPAAYRPDDAVLVAGCGLPDGAVKAVYSDQYGGTAVLVGREDVSFCVFDLDGRTWGTVRRLADSVIFENHPQALNWGEDLVATADSPNGTCRLTEGRGYSPGGIPWNVSVVAVGPGRFHVSPSPHPTVSIAMTPCVRGLQAVGVVPATAVRVTVTFGSYGSVTVPVGDGFFAARIYPPDLGVDGHGNPAAFRMDAYDSAGRLVGTATQPF